MSDAPVTRRSEGFAEHVSRVVSATIIIAFMLGLCWSVEVLDYADSGGLSARYGIQPHNLDTIWHIFTAPFLHANIDHIMANSLPLAILGFLTAVRGTGRFAGVSLIIMVASGLGVWFLALPGTVTVGASGLIFGYFGYLLARGFVERRLLDIAVAFLVALLYGTIILGALPGHPGISWQAHMFGLFGGVFAAWLTRQRPEP